MEKNKEVDLAKKCFCTNCGSILEGRYCTNCGKECENEAAVVNKHQKNNGTFLFYVAFLSIIFGLYVKYKTLGPDEFGIADMGAGKLWFWILTVIDISILIRMFKTRKDIKDSVKPTVKIMSVYMIMMAVCCLIVLLVALIMNENLMESFYIAGVNGKFGFFSLSAIFFAAAWYFRVGIEALFTWVIAMIAVGIQAIINKRRKK